MHAPTEESKHTHQHQINMVFANRSKKDVIYPLTVKEIAQAQEDDAVLKVLRGYTSLMQMWQDGHPQNSSAKSSQLVLPLSAASWTNTS
jgi:hypothetical protein